MQTTLWQENQTIWQSFMSKVNHAIVYLDTGMAELLHWSGGIGLLLAAGADDVREFSSFEGASENHQKGVFVVSSPLLGVTEEIIRDVVTQSRFQYVVVMTTVSPLLHVDSAAQDTEGDGVFEEFEEKVLEWMGNMNYTAEVVHLPLFSAVVCQELFLAPTFSSLFPLTAADVNQISYQYNATRHGKDSKSIQSLEDVECSNLPEALQQQIKMLSSGLHALLQVLDVREDIYSVGHTSRLIATELESYPPARSRRKTCQNRASIVLLDRTLDTASALTHQMDTLLDRLMNTLPRLEGHSSDCQVDMSSLCQVDKSSSSVILPGSLASTDSSKLPSHLVPLIHKRQKEALMDVNRKLVETAASEKLPLNLAARPGRVTADQLDSTLALFSGKYPLISKHLDTLQVAAAMCQTLRHPSSGHLDSQVALEKNLVQAVAEEGDATPSGLAVLYRAIVQEAEKPVSERSLSLDDILCLLTFTFSVSDGDCGDEEEAKQMREKLVELIVRDGDDLPPVVRHIVGDKVNESILSDQVESLWEKLQAVGEERSSMQQFRSVLDPGDMMTPAHVRPLLRRVVEAVVDPNKPELVDVECKSGGLKDLLKSGFGFFKSSGKPRPGDAPLLVLFVVGGVTSGEVKQVRDLLEKAKPGLEVLIGSTCLTSQEATLRSLYVNDNVNIDIS
ncbi:sec1 family domain-containing protein 2 isoform X1 [Aplysia californica]|uniref:Sec1 family domain-containing protein 2 isoform X1 n=1 Tax=Aplysia californica TaxID=6500 RepID=A0ABM0K8T8_APLCA|nr:sec1 family domain-containing protein 2 isoform X1 [Aplysia californica]